MKLISVLPRQFMMSSDSSVYHLVYTEGFFCTGFDSANSQAFCYWIADSDWNESDLEGLLQKISLENFSQDTTQLKIIGPLKYQQNVQAHILERGWNHSKYVDSKTIDGDLYFYSENGRLRISTASDEESSQAPLKKIKVLIIDDSSTIHQVLIRIFKKSKDIEVVGAISDPSKAENAIETLKPDVLTVDINMDKMDGVSLLKKLFATKQIPALLVSSLSINDGPQVLAGLEAGAVDYIQKPSFEKLNEFSGEIIQKVRMASRVNFKSTHLKSVSALAPVAEMDTSGLIAFGASTGGTEALVTILTHLPKKIPAVFIVQHIPAGFSKAFAKRLDDLCSFEVKEAEDGDVVTPGKVYLAPGGLHMRLKKINDKIIVRIYDDLPVNRHKPSIDVLFESVAQLGPASKTCGVILTGMGSDGASGLLKMKNAGMRTFAQDQNTSIVYGMPRVAMDIGAAEQSLPLDEIASALVVSLRKQSLAS